MGAVMRIGSVRKLQGPSHANSDVDQRWIVDWTAVMDAVAQLKYLQMLLPEGRSILSISLDQSVSTNGNQV